MKLSEILASIEAQLEALAPAIVLATGPGAVQGARAVPSPQGFKTPAPGQPDRAVVTVTLELARSTIGAPTRNGDGVILLQDELILNLSAPVSATGYRDSRAALLDAEGAVIVRMNEPAFAVPLRLSYQGTTRAISPPGAGSVMTAALRFNIDQRAIRPTGVSHA